MTMQLRTRWTALATVACLILIAPAVAAEPVASTDGRTLSVTINNSDLDMASAAGQRRATERLAHAIEELCPRSILLSYGAHRDCKAAAMKSAKRQERLASSRSEDLAAR